MLDAGDTGARRVRPHAHCVSTTPASHVQDVAGDMEDELYGYADASKLQVRGPERKWALS